MHLGGVQSEKLGTSPTHGGRQTGRREHQSRCRSVKERQVSES